VNAAPAEPAVERLAGGAFLLFVVTLAGPIAAMSISAALCGTLTLLCWALRIGPRPVRNPVQWPALAWFAALALSTLFAVGGPSPLRPLSKGLMPVIVAVAAWYAARRTHGLRVVAVLLGAAAVSAVIGVTAWLMQGATLEARAHGVSGHYMTYAGQMLLLTSTAAGIALSVGERRWRIAAGAVAVLGVIALAATLTRSAWIGLVVALGVILALTRPRALLVLGGAVVLIVVFAPGAMRERLASIVDPNHPWNQQRLLMWQAGLHMFRDHPVTGVGLRDLHEIYARYRLPGATEPAGHLHNVVVQIAATMGVVGLGAFAWLYGALVTSAARGLRAALHAGGLAAGLRLGVTAALAGFLAAGLFEWNFGDEELLYLLYTLVGVAWAARAWDAPAVLPRAEAPAVRASARPLEAVGGHTP
jgi:O-antigen ligase